MWCQNVALFAHVASGSQVASPDVASKRHLPMWRQGARRCGVNTWRHLLTASSKIARCAVNTYVAAGRQVASLEL